MIDPAIANLACGMKVKRRDSGATLIIEGFSQQKRDQWVARVFFACDPRATTFDVPAIELAALPSQAIN